MTYEILRARLTELESTLRQTPERQLRRLPQHINDPQFAAAVVEAYLELAAAR